MRQGKFKFITVFELFSFEGKSITQTKVVLQILVLLRFLFEITRYNGPVFNLILTNKLMLVT
jgi:hypothetical protein